MLSHLLDVDQPAAQKEAVIVIRMPKGHLVPLGALRQRLRRRRGAPRRSGAPAARGERPTCAGRGAGRAGGTRALRRRVAAAATATAATTAAAAEEIARARDGSEAGRAERREGLAKATHMRDLSRDSLNPDQEDAVRRVEGRWPLREVRAGHPPHVHLGRDLERHNQLLRSHLAVAQVLLWPEALAQLEKFDEALAQLENGEAVRIVVLAGGEAAEDAMHVRKDVLGRALVH